jgi:hypothetical protein
MRGDDIKSILNAKQELGGEVLTKKIIAFKKEIFYLLSVIH